jgi:pyrroline-5-carboxylate reductase
LSEELGIRVGTDNSAAVHDADIVLVCVKPQLVQAIMEQIRPSLSKQQLIISVAASVMTSEIEKGLATDVPIVRAMPNTPCAWGCGMTVLCKGRFADSHHLEIACALFDLVGKTVVVEEKHMDAATGLSASGPAYIYIILESLAEAGVKLGLPREVAILKTGDHPALLKDAVTTPGGCTIDGILELEEGKIRVTLIKAVVRAAQRGIPMNLSRT